MNDAILYHVIKETKKRTKEWIKEYNQKVSYMIKTGDINELFKDETTMATSDSYFYVYENHVERKDLFEMKNFINEKQYESNVIVADIIESVDIMPTDPHTKITLKDIVKYYSARLTMKKENFLAKNENLYDLIKMFSSYNENHTLIYINERKIQEMTDTLSKALEIKFDDVVKKGLKGKMISDEFDNHAKNYQICSCLLKNLKESFNTRRYNIEKKSPEDIFKDEENQKLFFDLKQKEKDILEKLKAEEEKNKKKEKRQIKRIEKKHKRIKLKIIRKSKIKDVSKKYSELSAIRKNMLEEKKLRKLEEDEFNKEKELKQIEDIKAKRREEELVKVMKDYVEFAVSKIKGTKDLENENNQEMI